MKTLICFFSLFFFISCDNQKNIKSISTSELKELLAKEKIQLLDVRTPEEIKQGFIKTANFADFYADDFYTQATNQLDKNKTVYVYCKSGGRSKKASKILQDNGFKVLNIKGGYTAWKTN